MAKTRRWAAEENLGPPPLAIRKENACQDTFQTTEFLVILGNVFGRYQGVPVLHMTSSQGLLSTGNTLTP
jgi:hypothetical protein